MLHLFTIKKLFHKEIISSAYLQSQKWGLWTDVRSPEITQSRHSGSKTLLLGPAHCPFCHCVTSSQPSEQGTASPDTDTTRAPCWSIWCELDFASLWVPLKMCLFSPYCTVCLQPSRVVCPQLHLHLNVVGSLPWVGASPRPTPPQSPVCSRAYAHGHTLVSLSSCQVYSVCVCLGVE